MTMPVFDVDVVIDLRGPGGNAHDVAVRVEEALESAVGKDAAEQFKSAFVMFIGQSDATYEGVLDFCSYWADVTYIRH